MIHMIQLIARNIGHVTQKDALRLHMGYCASARNMRTYDVVFVQSEPFDGLSYIRPVINIRRMWSDCKIIRNVSMTNVKCIEFRDPNYVYIMYVRMTSMIVIVHGGYLI